MLSSCTDRPARPWALYAGNIFDILTEKEGERMPKKASGLFDQKEYVKAYHREFRIEKKLTFNRKNPDDMALLEWLEGQPEGTVQYLKRLIREDMKGSEE